MLPFSLFDQALPYEQFLATYGTPADKARWDRTRATVSLTDAQKRLLGCVGKHRIEQSIEQTFLRRRCCAL